MKQRWTRWFLSAALALAGCQAPVGAPSGMPPQAAMTIEAARAVDALGDRPNALWQDALFTNRAVQERRKTSRYRVQTVTAPASWPAPAALPAVSTNGVAYAHHDTSFGDQAPGPTERVWVVCDDAAGTVVRLNPSANGAVVGPNYPALAGLAGAGTVTKSAILLSGKNERVYLLTSGGYFVMLDAKTGTRLAAIKLSASGFANIAPYIDYSNGGGTPGLFNDEFVYALAADGSLYRVRCNSGVQVTGWRAAGGADAAALGTGLGATSGTLTTVNAGITAGLAYTAPMATRCKASPIVWGGNAYFGGADGKFYRVRTATGALDSITVSSYGVETTPAIEFDDWLNVTDAFIPAGDRLHWIDVTNPATLSRKAISPPLVLDKKPASQAVGASGVLGAYAYNPPGSLMSLTATDWAAASTTAPAAGQGPSRWGGGATDLGAYNTVANPWGLERHPTDGGLWFTTPTDNRIRRMDPLTGAITATYDGNGNYAALVQTIPVSTRPTGLTDDPINGGVWVSCYGANSVSQINAAGVVVRTITGVPSPTALAYDQRGTVGVAGDDVLWVCSTTLTAGVATGALLRVRLSDGNVTSFDNTNTIPTTVPNASRARNWNDFGGGTPADNSLLAPTDWRFRGPQGVCVDGNGMVWVANTAQNLSLGAQNSGQTAVYPFQLDGTGSNASQDGVNNDRSSLLIFNPTTNQFTDRIVCTGAPYGLAYSAQGGGSIWVGTYRWGQDVVERYDEDRLDTYARMYRSTQTTNHWQPRWVAVDDPNNRMWVVNGNSSWDAANPTAPAVNGLDAVRASATGTGAMAGGNANFLGTYQTGSQPRGVDVDSTGNVWVANSVGQTVTKYSGTGAPLGTYPVGNQPYAVVCDRFDVAWVANQADNTVTRMTPTTLPPAPLNNPRGVTVDNGGNLWIANAGNDTLTVLNTTGNTALLSPSTSSQPYGLEANGTGSVWVTNNNAVRVHRVNAATGAVTDLNGGGNHFGVALNAAGNAFITVPNANRVATAAAAGGFGANITVGTTPRGLAVHQGNGDVWVANQGSNNVSRLVAGAGPAVNFAVGNGPQGVAVEGNQVWVANTAANSITRMTATAAGGRAAVGTSLGTIAAYAGAGGPMQMAVDAQENLWVANTTQARMSKIWFAGQQDLMGAQHYRGADANGSFAYVRFPIGSGVFGGRTPLTGNIRLTALTNSARASESLAFYDAAPSLGGGTPWIGFAGTPTVDWNARPALGSAVGTTAAATVTAGNAYNFPITLNADVADTSNGPWDPTNAIKAYAFQSQGTSLADVAHWSTVPANRPQLQIGLSTTKLGAAGLRSQPTIDSVNKRIYVMGTNAVFELRYDTPANFADRNQIAYSFSRAGINAGPLATLTDYVAPSGASTLTYSGTLVTVDYEPGINSTTLNAYAIGATVGGFFLNTSGNNTVQLATTASVPGPLTNSQITYDYDRGSVYVVSGATVRAVKLLQ
jgi:streptogramin lyase